MILCSRSPVVHVDLWCSRDQELDFLLVELEARSGDYLGADLRRLTIEICSFGTIS
jgi:hypothetical protein